LKRDLELWRTHIGRTRTQREVLDPSVLRRFAVACGADPEVESRQPPMAHWAYFLEPAPNSRLGSDGHPLRGDFLPDVSLPRRMFAAATVQFPEPLELGCLADCTTLIADVRYKNGQSGELVFVELERRIVQKGRLRVDERQTIVYRGASAARVPVVPRFAPVSTDAWCPTPVELFRFSAVTFNSHRIHYDLPYAREVEGYPDLVVQGPFAATKLLAFARRVSPRPIQSFEFRLLAPMFVSQPVTFAQGEADGTFVALRNDGTRAVTSNVTLGE